MVDLSVSVIEGILQLIWSGKSKYKTTKKLCVRSVLRFFPCLSVQVACILLAALLLLFVCLIFVFVVVVLFNA